MMNSLAMLDAGILALRRDIERYVARTNLRIAALEAKAGFRPDQPRVPGGNPDGGQWTLAPHGSWSRPEKFKRHYRMHRHDFGVRTGKDYADKAQEFYQRALREKLPAVMTRYGYLKIYDQQTNTFGVYSPDGKTETFYKPKSRSYFAREIQKEIAKGGRVINPLPAGKPSEGGGPAFIDKPGLLRDKLPKPNN